MKINFSKIVKDMQNQGFRVSKAFGGGYDFIDDDLDISLWIDKTGRGSFFIGEISASALRGKKALEFVKAIKFYLKDGMSAQEAQYQACNDLGVGCIEELR